MIQRLFAFFISLRATHPARHWLLVLLFAGFLLLCEFAYAGYLFYGIRSGSIVGTADMSAISTTTVTGADIEKVLVLYRARKNDLDTKNFNLPPLSDPAR